MAAALARRPGWWTERLWTYPGDWAVYEGRRRGQIEGYLYYEVETSRGPFRLAVTLGEFVAATPEAHRGLIVRVAGYSDYFCDLSAALQEEIIARTEHGEL